MYDNFLIILTVLYRDCKDAYSQGQRISGVYVVQADAFPPFNVYCNMTTPGWTVFQRRQDGSVDFDRGWDEYVNGFGDLNGEFWLGLRNIYRLTNGDAQYQLRIDLKDFSNVDAYASYSSFKVFGPGSQYLLRVSGFTGTAGDSFSYHNGMLFTTKDVDNDISGINCAVQHRGAWWHKACHLSNLNGLYLAGPHPGVHFADGVVWHSKWGYYNSLIFTEMKIN